MELVARKLESGGVGAGGGGGSCSPSCRGMGRGTWGEEAAVI